jgi:hypothetical protein
MDTYVSHNGKRTIDLVFCNMKDMDIAYQRIICCTATTPIRKHIPVQTIFTLRPAQTVTADKKTYVAGILICVRCGRHETK